MRIQNISSNNYSQNYKSKSPSFKANFYGVFKASATDNWTKETMSKMPVTFVKQALQSGKINIINAALAEVRMKSSGEIIQNGIKLPEKVEYILMDMTTPEYYKYPFKIGPTSKDIDTVRDISSTEKINLFIDENETTTINSSKEIKAFLEELAKIYKIDAKNIQLDVPNKLLPKKMVKALEIAKNLNNDK